MRALRQWGLQGYRAGVLAAILFLIHFSASGKRATPMAEISVEDFAAFYPAGALLGESGPVPGSRSVETAEGGVLGYVIQTAPASDRFVGYSGPTDSLLAFGGDGKLLGWTMLASEDTPEHIELVGEDGDFAAQFIGKSWDELSDQSNYEGVSRATLTSLAIREGISARLSGSAPNLRFPKEVTFEEVAEIFPEANALSGGVGKIGVMDVLDEKGKTIGAVLRTAYLGDRVRGFQGPTDVLIALEIGRESVRTIRIRSSIDNEPYVGDMGFDDIFMRRFDGEAVEDIAAIGDDLEAEGIEGVSGATFTSLAVVETVREAMRDLMLPVEEVNESGGWISVAGRDIGLVGMLAMALLISFTRLRGILWLRVLFQIALIVYVGFLHGDLISQALLVGWAKSGVAWQTTVGLAVLVAVSFLVPWATGHQVYCHHVCPHGAAQQLLGKLVRWRIKIPNKLGKILEWAPGVLLLLVVVVGLLGIPFNLSALEPFDAYALWFAGGVTVLVAIAGLVASAFVPMAYCRYGCPTGAILKFVRRSGGGFRRRDWVGLGMLGLAASLLLV